MNTNAPHLTHEPPEAATTHPIAPRGRGSPSPARPTWRELLDETAPMIGTPALFGPPIIFLLGPWLLLVLLLIPPAALLITLVLVALVTAGLLAALAALIASPYLLVRHLRTRHASRPRRSTLQRRRSAPAVSDPAPHPRSRRLVGGTRAGQPAVAMTTELPPGARLVSRDRAQRHPHTRKVKT